MSRRLTGGYTAMRLSQIVQRGWDAFGAGNFDALVADYADHMRLVFPGQTNVLEGRQAFRSALDGLGEMLPPGFDVVGLRHIEGKDEVVSIVEWKSEKITSSQLAILFRFDGDKIYEERWFVDTEQWRSAL